MFLILILFLVGLVIGIKIAKSVRKKKNSEANVPSGTIEAEEVKEPIKAIKVAGLRIDLKELREKSSHLCEGLKHIIEIER